MANEEKPNARLDCLREGDLVLRDVGREVDVLQEDVTDEPLSRTANLAARDARNAVASGVIGIDGREQYITRVDIELLAAERERDGRVRGAREREPALAVRLRAGDRSVHSVRVAGGRDDERGAGVEDRGTSVQPEALPVHADVAHRALPEALRVHVGERRLGRGIELGGVEAAEGDLAVVVAVGDPAEFKGDDGVGDAALVGERLDGSGYTLLGECLL